MSERPAGASLATKPFFLLCLATGLGYMNQWVLTPVIPLYVDDLGASAFFAGLVLLAFAIPSFGVRPFLGRVADRWSAAGVVAIGLVGLAAGTLLMLAPVLMMLFIGNAVRGLGWAGINTGAYTMLAIVAPQERRGEAAGYFSAVLATVAIAFPVLGLWLVALPNGFQTTLLASTLLGLLGLPIALSLAKTHGKANPPPASDAGEGGGLIDRGVLLATGLNLCTSLVSPALMAFLPLHARSLGIDNIGWYYVLAGVTGVFIRPLLGKQSDAMGRGPAIALGLCAQLAGLVLIMLARDIGPILAGGVLTTVGTGLIGATTTALAMDLADARFRGRAMATYSMSFQMGAGTGAALAGALIDLSGFRGMYIGCIVITLAGFAVLAGAWRALPRPQKAARI